jgi:hypothetical protein
MKVKHNKKRNTAFLFEALVREVTKSVVKRDKLRTKIAKSILAEHFSKGKPLSREVECYDSIVAEQGIDKDTAEKILTVAKESYNEIDSEEIFKEQSSVIKKINTHLDRGVYNNFVPNYRSFATIAQVFGNKGTIKSRVLMEQTVVEEMTSTKSEKEEMKPVDSLVVKSFSENFNKQYSSLLKEQKDFLGKYIISFGTNEVDFRLHAGKELKRIKEEVEKSLELDEVNQDEEMINTTNQVLSQIESINVSNLQKEDILRILKLQKLVSEYQSNDD